VTYRLQLPLEGLNLSFMLSAAPVPLSMKVANLRIMPLALPRPSMNLSWSKLGVPERKNIKSHVNSHVKKDQIHAARSVTKGVVDGRASSDAACHAGGPGLIPGPGQTYV
jgi:hypothetical protein